MGRPYAAELQELDATYDWSLQAPIADLCRSIARCASLDTLFIGSGGSLTSAHFAGFLHGYFTGRPFQTLTPYEFASLPRTLDHTAIAICSAGGSNPDVIAAAELAIKRSPAQLFAVITRARSPLERLFDAAGWPTCHAFATPTKKDGFLATNSLLATVVLFTRAYHEYAGTPVSLPTALGDLLHPGSTRAAYVERCREAFGPLAARSTLIVLHGGATKPAAMDVESRCTEAALANVQPADYRNFAHGRHHWLARHGASSAVLAFSENGDDVAHRTLALLPAWVPRWHVAVGQGPAGAMAAICQSLFLAHVAGEAKGIDPGRPHVPTFGRKLYHLRAMPRLFAHADAGEERRNLAVQRKAGAPVTVLAACGSLDHWFDQYGSFVERLADARIRALVVDYDGTLCGPERRLTGPTAEVIRRLNGLLEAGITVAVATGRGKSVRDLLRKHIRSSAHRRRVLLGYHNGAEIGTLIDADCPPDDRPLAAELAPITQALRDSPVIASHATVEAKGEQISVELHPTGNGCVVYDEVSRLVRERGLCGKLALATSSHSVDVLAGGVSKSNVVAHLVTRLQLDDGGADSLLCIGDRGRAPGNDADLLRHPLSLSVDQVSDDPTRCWNIAQPGLRFDRACLEYLNRLRPGRTGLRFDVKGVRP